MSSAMHRMNQRPQSSSKDQKEKRKGLAGLVAERKRIKPESARKWIKRMENKGLSPKKIIENAKERIFKERRPRG